jgi:glycosyltransferase involved in cell wall biosynthesis
VHTHMRSLREFLSRRGQVAQTVTPFHCHPVLVYPVFGLRRLIDGLSKSASVWWYRHWHYVFLKRALRHLPELDGPAVIYAQCPLSAKAALETRRSRAQRVVMIVHFNVSQADEWCEQRGIALDGWVSRGIRSLEAAVLPRLDGIVHVSRFMKQKIETRIEALRLVDSRVIPNGCPPPPKGENDVAGDLITIGSLEPRKNQRYLLEVLAHAKRLGYCYTLTVVGTGPHASALETQVRRLGLEREVRFLGRRDDAPGLIGGHRLYVHAATMEAFGIVLIEALAAGRPVLAAPVGGITEVFDDGVEGFYWPLDDPARGAGRLIELLEHPEVYERMTRAAAQRYRRDYTIERAGEALTAFLLARAEC